MKRNALQFNYDDAPVNERPDLFVSITKARCEVYNLKVTLWLLFDTAATRDSVVRDKMLKDFKTYAARFGKPRSVAVGAKWLAQYWGDYAD